MKNVSFHDKIAGTCTMPSITNQTTMVEQPSTGNNTIEIHATPNSEDTNNTDDIRSSHENGTTENESTNCESINHSELQNTATIQGSELQNKATIEGSKAINISKGEHQQPHEPQKSRYGRTLKPTSKLN